MRQKFKWKKVMSAAMSVAIAASTLVMPVSAAGAGGASVQPGAGSGVKGENGNVQAELFISPDGDDVNGDGSAAKPFASLEAARDAVRKINRNMTGDIYVNVAEGDYYVDETVVFQEEDSADNGNRIIYRSQDGVGKARFIGGFSVEPSSWAPVERTGADADLPASAEGRVYKSHVGTDVIFNTLYVNDSRATQARTPNLDAYDEFPSALTPYLRSAGGGTGDLVYKAGDLDAESIAGLVNAQERGDLDASVYMWDGGYWDWMTDTIPIGSVDVGSRRLSYKKVEGHPEIYRPKYATRNNARYFVQGNLGFLDAEGEYYFNKTTGDLYYYPAGDIRTTEVVIPAVREIIRVEGSSRDSMVSGLTFSGLKLSDTETTDWYAYGWNWGDAGDGLGFYPKEAEGSTQPSYCEQTERIEFQYGVVTLKNTDSIEISECHVTNAGMFGVELYLANQNAVIEDCLINNTGHGGINIDGGYPGVAGDKNGDGYSRDNTVNNVIVHNVGELIGQATGVTVQQSSYNTISHVEVYNSPRRGIFLTAGNSRNPNGAFPDGDKNYNPMTDMYSHHNTFEYCYIHDCQQDGGDDGAFFACYLYKGKNNKPNYINQMLLDSTGANPTMTDLGPNNMNLDMGCSGVELHNVKSVNPMNFNMEVNTILQYGDVITFDNTNIDYGTLKNQIEDFDDSKMEYDKIGVTDDFPAEYLPEKDVESLPEDIWFQDDFEQGIDSTKWYSRGAEEPQITTQWMSEDPKVGKQGLQLKKDSVLFRTFDEKIQKTVRVNMFDRQNNNLAGYDSGVKNSSKATSFALVGEGENAVGLGLTEGNMSTYALQIGEKRTATNIPRTFGWHEFVFDYSDGENAVVYLDGVQVAEVASDGFQTISLGADDGSGITYYDQLYIYGGKEAGPIVPLPAVYKIPGTVEAEAYLASQGVDIEKGTGAEGSDIVTGIAAGDWMEYSVKVAGDGAYNAAFQVKVPAGVTAEFELSMDGQAVKTFQVESADGGWQSIDSRVSLKSGLYKMGVKATAGSFDMDRMDFTFAGREIPCKIEAEDFSNQQGTSVEQCAEGGMNVGYIDDGDWLEYVAYVPVPGKYAVNYRAAVNGSVPGVIGFEANGKTLAETSLPKTGGWQAWGTVTDVVEFEEAGAYTIRLNVIKGGFNLNWFELSTEGIPEEPEPELPPVLEELLFEEDFEGEDPTFFTPNKSDIKQKIVEIPEAAENSVSANRTADFTVSGGNVWTGIADISGNDMALDKADVSDNDLTLPIAGTINKALSVNSPDGTIYLPGGEEWSNYVFTCRIMVDKWNETYAWDNMAPAWYLDPSNPKGNYNRYTLKLHREDQQFKLYRRLEGSGTPDKDIVSKAAPADFLGSWHDYKVVMDNGLIQVFVDGEKIFEETNTDLSAGTIGFDGVGAEYYVDDIKLTRQKTDAPTASVESGEFQEGFHVKLTPAAADAAIAYTLDGSDPVSNGKLYDPEKGIDIKETTTLKFAAAEHGKMYSDVVICEYKITVPVVIDKSELIRCNEQYGKLEQGSYTDESWAVFEAARKEMNRLLEDDVETTQDEVNAAVAAMDSAYQSLEKVLTEARRLLKMAYDYGLEQDTTGVAGSVVEIFEAAMEKAKNTLADDSIPDKEVTAVLNELIDAIQALGIVQGDKTMLAVLINQADLMIENKAKYVQTDWKQLEEALEAANIVMDDNDALQEDVDKAADDLLKAILIQRYKAQKDILEEIIKRANDIDQTLYTEESAAIFRSALSRALSVMKDESLSQDDQKLVDDTANDLDNAILNLVKKDEGDPDDGNKPDDGNTPDDGNKPDDGNTPDDGNKPDDGNTPDDGNNPDDGSRQENGEASADAGPEGTLASPKTGDNAGFGLAFILMASGIVCMTGFFWAKRRKNNA